MLNTAFTFVCFDSYFLQYFIFKDIVEKKQTLKHSLDLVSRLNEVRFEENNVILASPI